jgi:adenosylcobyric acid synthase
MHSSLHGGNLTHFEELSGLPRGKILDFSANINPLGPPEWLRSVVSSVLESVVHYPDPHASRLVDAVAVRYHAERDQVVAGNGSTELLHLIPRALDATRAIIPVPSYVDYVSASENAGLEVKTIPLKESEGFVPNAERLSRALQGNELVFIGQPNNPTGMLFPSDQLRIIARKHPSTWFVIDEAFSGFVEGMDSLTVNRPDNVIVLLSLTKIFAIPGLRLGCGIADPSVKERMERLQPYWSVNTVAQAVGEAALGDLSYLRHSRDHVSSARHGLVTELRSIPGLTVYPGEANFLLVRIDRDDVDAPTLGQRMVREGIAIRICSNFAGLDDRFFRVAVRNAEENETMCASLKRSIGLPVRMRRRRHTPALMFQGTSSNAGKSVLTAALGRILLQDGYRVAPFKAQNMSLNSFVTRTGGEMGRAQVVQAQACRLDPEVRMNPILLKPNSDTGSQVIVLGKPVGNMDVSEYVKYKRTAVDAVRTAYDSLAQDYDAIVLEGAGSPAEVNLKHHDIVNMKMARYAHAPVLLVGDIDRGGVFASFIGTMEVLSETERAMVAGFVVNRFRGDETLLKDALDYTLGHTGRPVFGVVPYFTNLGLPEEDSVTFKSGLFDSTAFDEDFVEIAVIDLPHISNFTDFDAFRIEPDVRLRIVRTVEELNRPDAIVLPGSKNVIGDLEHLKKQGLDARIRQLVSSTGVELVGLCGGFQMIGTGIADPHGLESDSKALQALGFLNISTVLAQEKTLTRVTATHLESGLTVRGYEIHHGITDSPEVEPVVGHEDGRTDGARSPDGAVWGTYVHGIFDEDEFRRWFIDRLRAKRGLAPKGAVCARYDLEPALNRLADAVRSRLDMPKVYELMGLR